MRGWLEREWSRGRKGVGRGWREKEMVDGKFFSLYHRILWGNNILNGIERG